MPTCWIIAGPNGAGKTTFALEYLPKLAKSLHFINADLIASGLSPLAPEKELLTASRLFLNEVKEHIENKEDFSFETTLSGRNHLNTIKKLRQDNWHVELIYLALPSIEMSKSRVAERVKHGGHNIPIRDIERRFSRSLNNLLNLYCNEVNYCFCLMNQGKEPVLVFEQKNKKRKIYHDSYYQLIADQAKL